MAGFRARPELPPAGEVYRTDYGDPLPFVDQVKQIGALTAAGLIPDNPEDIFGLFYHEDENVFRE